MGDACNNMHRELFITVPPLYLRRLQSRLRGLFCRLIEPVFEVRLAQLRVIVRNQCPLGLLTNAGQSFGFFNQNLKVPYMERWQFSIQRQLPRQVVVELAYVGNHGSELRVSRQFDPVPRQYISTAAVRDQPAIDFLSTQAPNPFFPLLPKTSLSGANIARSQLLRPYPEFTSITGDLNDGYSRYHSLQTRIEKRMTQGFTVNLAWTW